MPLSPRIVGDVKLGVGNRFGEGVVLRGPLTLGDRNVVEDHVVVGADARVGVGRHRFGVGIGDDCFLGHHSSIDSGVDRPTTLLNGISVGAHSHVGHDSMIGNGVILAIGVVVGGHVEMFDWSGAGLNSTVHPRTAIGPWSFIGAGSTVLTHVDPVSVVAGSPAKWLRWNIHSVNRSMLDMSSVHALRDYCEYGDLPPAELEVSGLISEYLIAKAQVSRNPVLRDWEDARWA